MIAHTSLGPLDKLPEGAWWTSVEDPAERAIVRGTRLEIWRRVWPLASRERPPIWVCTLTAECASEYAAHRVARARGHLPPSEGRPPADVQAALARARAAEERALDLDRRLAGAGREILPLRRDLRLSF